MLAVQTNTRVNSLILQVNFLEFVRVCQTCALCMLDNFITREACKATEHTRTCVIRSLDTRRSYVMIMMMMMLIVMAVTSAVRDALQSPYCAANCPQHVRSRGQGAVPTTCSTSGAYHVQCVAFRLVRRDSSAINFHRSNRIYFNYIALVDPIHRGGRWGVGGGGRWGGETRVPRGEKKNNPATTSIILDLKPEIQAPTETVPSVPAMMACACWESRRACHCTLRLRYGNHMVRTVETEELNHKIVYHIFFSVICFI